MLHLKVTPCKTELQAGDQPLTEHLQGLRVISEDCAAFDSVTGSLVLLYVKGFASNDEAMPLLHEYKFSKDIRPSGLLSETALFGTTAPDFRRTFPMRGRIPRTSPALGAVIHECVPRIEKLMRDHGVVNNTKIHDDWMVPGSKFFSSGIVNKSMPLAYHRDRNNIPGTWNAMLTFRGRGASGGLLAVPELGVALACAEGDLSVFEAQKYLHGVTPLVGERYSVVYYTQQRLESLGTFQEEFENAKKKRMAIEYKIQSADALRKAKL